MLQVCILGGHDGIIRPEKKLCLTVLGGADFKRATIARQILTDRQRASEGAERPVQMFITILG